MAKHDTTSLLPPASVPPTGSPPLDRHRARRSLPLSADTSQQSTSLNSDDESPFTEEDEEESLAEEGPESEEGDQKPSLHQSQSPMKRSSLFKLPSPPLRRLPMDLSSELLPRPSRRWWKQRTPDTQPMPSEQAQEGIVAGSSQHPDQQAPSSPLSLGEEQCSRAGISTSDIRSTQAIPDSNPSTGPSRVTRSRLPRRE